MSSENQFVLEPVISTIVSDNKKLVSSLEALKGKYTLTLDVALDTKNIDKLVSDLQSKINKVKPMATVKFSEFEGADVSLKRISAVTAEKLKQKIANEQLLSNERQRAAVEEANSKIIIAQSRAKIQSDKEEIQQSRLKIQLENERVKLLRLAQQEAKITPTDMQSKLLGKMNNTLAGNLSTGDTAALQKLRDDLTAVDLATGNAKIKIREFEQQYKELQKAMKQGTLVDNSFGINTGSTDNQFKQYIAGLKQVKEEQVKITNSSKIMFGSDGSQIRVVNALITDGAGKWQKYQYAVNATNNQVRELNKGVQEVSKGTDNAIDAMATAIVASGVLQGLEKIKDVLYACVEAAAEFETAMAGVRRTVGGSDAEINAIAESITKLSTTIPITRVELGKLGEYAGQLGIERENIVPFIDVMARLGTATDITSEQAAKMLAEFSNITGLDPSNFERMGSTIAALGDSTAATTTKISDISLRIAAAASIAGFSEREIIALSATIGSLGVESEAGGSAMAKLITELQMAVETGDKLNEFASVANMSAEQFTQMWGTNAIGALNAFTSGLNDTERNGMTAIAMLKELGIEETRMTRAVLSLANSGDMLSTIIGQANKEWQDNTALTEKSAIMYETTAAKMQLLENSTNQLKVSVGDALAPLVNVVVDGLTDLSQAAAEFVDNNQWLVQTLTPLVAMAGTAAAGLVAYGAAVKAIKVLDLGTHFKSMINFFKGLGRLKIRSFNLKKVFRDIARCIIWVQNNRFVLLIHYRAHEVIEVLTPINAIA